MTGWGCSLADLARLERPLPLALELEDFLQPGFAERAWRRLPEARRLLGGFTGRLLLSGPYIDLNPGSPDPLIRSAVLRRLRQTARFARGIGAQEIICLSTFLPLVRLDFYEDDWVRRSADFWRAFLDEQVGSPPLRILLANTFEETPQRLVEVAEGVGSPNFGLAFDLGHFLVYGRIPLEGWAAQIAPWCRAVYVHSNDGQVDLHLPPGEGVLQAEQVRSLAGWLAPEVVWILKPFEKGGLVRGIEWLKAALDS